MFKTLSPVLGLKRLSNQIRLYHHPSTTNGLVRLTPTLNSTCILSRPTILSSTVPHRTIELLHPKSYSSNDAKGKPITNYTDSYASDKKSTLENSTVITTAGTTSSLNSGTEEMLSSEQQTITSTARLMIAFTCKCCSHRSYKSISKQAYYYGVVIIECEGCKQRHLIADHLGYFDTTKKPQGNIENILKLKGEKVTKRTIIGSKDIHSDDVKDTMEKVERDMENESSSKIIPVKKD